MVYEQVAQPQYFESHPNDSRVTGPHDVGNTVSARYGTGGGNTPIVSQPIAYSFDSLASNSMKSSNPHSGCRKVETSKTIDTTTPEPSKNQGGIAIAQPIPIHDQATRFQGKRGDKQDGKGNGLGIGNEGDVMNTLKIARSTGASRPGSQFVTSFCSSASTSLCRLTTARIRPSANSFAFAALS